MGGHDGSEPWEGATKGFSSALQPRLPVALVSPGFPAVPSLSRQRKGHADITPLLKQFLL